MKYILFAFSFFLSVSIFSQVDAGGLLGVLSVTTAERNAITGTITEGSLVYDSDVNRVYEFTDTGWQEILTAGSNTYLGVFIITSPGVVTVGGLPFRPSSVSFVAHPNIETLNVNADNGVDNNINTSDNSFGTMNGFARNDSGTIVQQVIYLGGSGNSINDISRFASNANAIGVRYGDRNGDNLGVITGSVTGFLANGFRLTATFSNVDIQSEDLVVLFTAYR